MSRTTGKAGTHKPLKKLETIWEDLLSRQPEKIRAAYEGLEPDEQQAIFVHLQRMASEADWQPEQRNSAQAALLALRKQTS
jgi:hypothetical protein